jgi:hypothetical protein
MSLESAGMVGEPVADAIRVASKGYGAVAARWVAESMRGVGRKRQALHENVSPCCHRRMAALSRRPIEIKAFVAGSG